MQDRLSISLNNWLLRLREHNCLGSGKAQVIAESHRGHTFSQAAKAVGELLFSIDLSQAHIRDPLAIE